MTSNGFVHAAAARELAVAELVDADAGQADSLTGRRNRALGRDHGAARSVTSERAASSSASLRSGWCAVHHASGAQAPGEAGVSAVLGRIRRAPGFASPRGSHARHATPAPG